MRELGASEEFLELESSLVVLLTELSELFELLDEELVLPEPDELEVDVTVGATKPDDLLLSDVVSLSESLSLALLL